MSAFTNPLTYLILILLHALAWLYAYRCVRPTRHANPRHGQTAMFVVLGDAAVALAIVLVAAASGPLAWLDLAVVLIAALAAGGLPMIWEYIDDHTSGAVDARRRAYAADLQRLLDEE